MTAAPAATGYGVFIPAFDAERTLAEAIDSAAAQTIPPSMILVVDDGSTDATASIARSYGSLVTLVRQANCGPAAATDRALQLVTTPFVAGLDADDVWLPEKAERQLAWLGAHPGTDAVFCRAASFPHGERPDFGRAVRDLWGRSSMMIRREAVAAIGAVADPEQARGIGEMVRWFDTGRRGGLHFHMMRDVLVGRRIIEGSLSHRHPPAAMLAMIRSRLRQRR